MASHPCQVERPWIRLSLDNVRPVCNKSSDLILAIGTSYIPAPHRRRKNIYVVEPDLFCDGGYLFMLKKAVQSLLFIRNA